jgi:hypothetical protein
MMHKKPESGIDTTRTRTESRHHTDVSRQPADSTEFFRTK